MSRGCVHHMWSCFFPRSLLNQRKFVAVFHSIVIEGPRLDRVIYYERPVGAQIAWKVYRLAHVYMKPTGEMIRCQ